MAKPPSAFFANVDGALNQRKLRCVSNDIANGLPKVPKPQGISKALGFDGNVAKAHFCAMGKRGLNSFKRNDAIRALQSCRDGGLEPKAMEVVPGADGAVTFRIFSEVPGMEGASAGSSKEWDREIAKLKGGQR